MERVIDIDIVNNSDLFEKYNKKKVNIDLINYLVKCVPFFTKKDNFKINVNNFIGDIDCISLIIDGLTKEYNDCDFRQDRNNAVQIVYFLLGLIILFLSTLIKIEVFKEIVLIGGWVFIWAIVEAEISSELELRKKQNRIKKLLESEWVENKVSSYED